MSQKFAEGKIQSFCNMKKAFNGGIFFSAFQLADVGDADAAAGT